MQKQTLTTQDGFRGAEIVLRNVRIVLGRRWMTGEQISRIRDGFIVELDAPDDEPVELYADGRLWARGELVRVEGRVGVRIQEIVELKSQVQPAGRP